MKRRRVGEQARHTTRTKRPTGEIPLLHPHALYRPARLCALFDIDRSTLVRWRKQGRLPPFTRVAGVEGLTGQQILDLYAQQQRGTAAMSDDAIAAGGEIADAGMGAQPKAPKALA